MRVLVTGGNKGIGKAIVARLLAEPQVSEVYFTCRDHAQGQEVVNSLSSNTKQKTLEFFMLEIMDDFSIETFFNELKLRKLVFDVFVHNAGIYRRQNVRSDWEDTL